jgi:hypothetical protein
MDYKNLKEMVDFIKSLPQLDKLKPETAITPAPETQCYSDVIIMEWFRIFYPDKLPTKEALDFVTEVLIDQQYASIDDDWLGYIQSVVEWLAIADKNPAIGRLNIFLYGYYWRKCTEEHTK